MDILTCYENMRKKQNDPETFHRLQSYFHAIEKDKTEEYHNQHGRGDKNNKKLF